MRIFFIKQRFLALGGKFDIKDDGDALAYQVSGSVMKFLKEYTVTDAQGNFVSQIKSEFFWYLPKFRVTLADGTNFRIAKRFTWFKDKYDISDFGLEVTGDLWSMNFALSQDGREVARISQKWLAVTSAYTVEVYEDSLSDLVVSLVIAIDYVKERKRANASG